MQPEIVRDVAGDCADAAMAVSSVSVVTNALRVRKVKL
jgi:cation transport ATPase